MYKNPVYYIIVWTKCKSILDSSCQFFRIFPAECFKTALIQGITDLFHEFIVKIQVMHDTKPHGEHFVCLKQVVDIRARMAAAGGTIASFVQR